MIRALAGPEVWHGSLLAMTESLAPSLSMLWESTDPVEALARRFRFESPTAVTGWYGQNVPYPGFGHNGGVVSSAVVIVGAAALLYVVFKRRGWL